MPVTVAGPRRIRTGFQRISVRVLSMNDEPIIEGGHGSRKSFISAQWRRSLFMATTVTARGGTVEAIPVAEVVRIVDGHGMVRR